MSAIDRRQECDGAWVRLVLDAPPGNVLSRSLVSELQAAVVELAGTPDLKFITIEGAGGDFSYGASIHEHLPPHVSQLLPAFHGLIDQLLQADVPTGAIVRGRCLGGGFELALACDFIFAADDASLGLPEVTLGVFPPAASALLPLKVGGARAARAVVTGETLPPAAWIDSGLITALHPARMLQDEVKSWYERHLAPRSAVALRYAARGCRETIRRTALPALAALEREYLDTLVATHDGLEGCAAFVDRRKPIWTNR